MTFIYIFSVVDRLLIMNKKTPISEKMAQKDKYPLLEK